MYANSGRVLCPCCPEVFLLIRRVLTLDATGTEMRHCKICKTNPVYTQTVCRFCRPYAVPRKPCRNCGSKQQHRSGLCKNCRSVSRLTQRNRLATWYRQNRAEERHRNKLEALHAELDRLIRLHIAAYGREYGEQVKECLILACKLELQFTAAE